MSRLDLLRRAATLVFAAGVGVLMVPTVVHAHTDFDYSLPTDGASVGVPLDEVTVAFTLPVTLVGNGFEVLDPQNNVLEPFAVTDDDTVFRLQFDPPLAGGTVAVKYEVRAEDGHVLSGNFVFVVDAPPPTTVPPTTTTPTSEATTTVATAVTTEPPVTTTTVPSTTAPGDVGDDESAAPGSDPEIAATESADDDGADDDDGSGLSPIVIIAAAVAAGAGGFLLIRSRTSGSA